VHARRVLTILVALAVLAGCQGPAPDPGQAPSTSTSLSPSAGCPSGLVPVDLRLPGGRDRISLNVLNATGVPGRAQPVFVDLGQRGFQMLSTTEGLAAVDQVAIIRYGPRAVGAGWVMRAYFLDQAVTEFDIKRADDRVDLVLGTRFRELGTVTEVNQALAQLGQPTAPPGTCDTSR
jgi:hypothetical protein